MDWENPHRWSDRVERYCDDVLSGGIVTGKHVQAAVQRYRDDLNRIGNSEFPYRFDAARANQMLDTFPVMLTHSTGEFNGQPFDLYPWQAFCMWNIFGWLKQDEPHRRFRDVFISVARGNGKSPLAAGILLTLFIADVPYEARAECYSCATTSKQARIVYNEAVRYVQRNKDLGQLVKIYKDQMKIPADDSTLGPLASDSHNLDGLVIHGVVRDELHAWRELHRQQAEKIDTAMQKRRQPLSVTITTAGNDDSRLWREQYDFSSQVARQLIPADTHFSCVWEIEDEDDPLDRDVWVKANPMLPHRVVKTELLEPLAQKAEAAPETFLAWKRYHCNRYVASGNKVISYELWDTGNKPLPSLDGEQCFVGFDWGWRDDLAALALVFPLYNDPSGRRVYAVSCQSWCPEDCKRDLSREPWATWINDGQLRVTSGDTTDTQAIFSYMSQLVKRYQIRGVCYDPNNAREFSTLCVNEWGLEAYGFLQTTRNYNEPIREFLQALREQRILHGGATLLGWAARNMMVKEDAAGYIMPHKSKSEDKIDPICAVLMGFSECLFQERKRPSVYEQRGPIFL